MVAPTTDDAAASPAAVVEPAESGDASSSTSNPTAPPEDNPTAPPEESVEASEASDTGVADLSPLAAETVDLPSAFPERVLDGLGDPIGVQPRAISLPSLGIDGAPIVPVGLEPNGELEVPAADAVGWYEFGAGVDGGRGSTVLAAHIAFGGVNGVFVDLVDMEPGDVFTIERDGEPLEYIVESNIDYDKLELPIDDLFSESSEERLVLITCGGSFNPDVRSYEDNTVVVAIPV